MIYQAYISKEISNFYSYYFEPYVQFKRTKVAQNDDGSESSIEPTLSAFNYPNHAARKCKDQWLLGNEWNSTHLHILVNCDKVEPFKGK